METPSRVTFIRAHHILQGTAHLHSARFKVDRSTTKEIIFVLCDLFGWVG